MYSGQNISSDMCLVSYNRKVHKNARLSCNSFLTFRVADQSYTAVENPDLVVRS
jgi:hypothetical protein